MNIPQHSISQANESQENELSGLVRHLDLEALRTLVAIERHGTFSSAAQHRHKTQSAITQQMRRLEDELGLPLFERVGRRKTLSPHGLKLVEYARHLLALNDEALRAIKGPQMEGRLRLGAPHDIAGTVLPPVLSLIMRASPRTHLDIRVDRSPFLMEALSDGSVDMILSTRVSQSFEGFIVRTSPTAWICASNYVLDRTRPISLILADEPSIFRRIALTTLEHHRIPWEEVHVAPNLVGIRAAVSAGLGVTARSIELLSPDMRVLGLDEDMPALPNVTYYLWIRRDAINPLTRHIYQALYSRLAPRSRPAR